MKVLAENIKLVCEAQQLIARAKTLRARNRQIVLEHRDALIANKRWCERALWQCAADVHWTEQDRS